MPVSPRLCVLIPPPGSRVFARTRCCSRYFLEGCEDWARAAGAVRSLVSGRPVCASVRQNQGTVAASEGMCPCQCVSANPEHPFPWPLAGFQNVSVLSALYPSGECPARFLRFLALPQRRAEQDVLRGWLPRAPGGGRVSAWSTSVAVHPRAPQASHRQLGLTTRERGSSRRCLLAFSTD